MVALAKTPSLRCAEGPDGSVTIPSDLAKRWSQQMSAAYQDLPEEQRESDREEVCRYLPVIIEAVRNSGQQTLNVRGSDSR